MFRNAKKEDLKLLCEEIGVAVTPDAKIVDLKNCIVSSKEFKDDPEFVKGVADTIIEERKSREDKQNKLEIEKIQLEKLEMEERRLENERKFELERARILAEQQNSGETRVSGENMGRNENVNNVENLIKSIRTLTLGVPSKSELWNLYFESLERAFLTKRVPEDLKAEILLNLLGEKATNLLVYVKHEDLKNYENLKSIVLREYEPTPQKCLENFRKAKRYSDENHVQFNSRLTAAFEYYCKLRKVNDMQTLKDLIISDKLAETLDSETATHIKIRQGENWFKPIELAKECDLYYTSKGKSFSESKFYSLNSREMSNKYIPPHMRQNEFRNKPKSSPVKRCYLCSSTQHLANLCSKRVQKSTYHPNKKQNEVQNESPIIAKVGLPHLSSASNIQPLQYVNIIIGGRKISAIVDSASQIPVIHEKHISMMNHEPHGKIILTSAFNEKVEAKLVLLQMSLNENYEHTCPISVLAASTNKLGVDCLIPPAIYMLLQTAAGVEKEGEEWAELPAESKQISVFAVENERESEIEERGISEEVTKSNEECTTSQLSEASKLRLEQLKCESLKEVRESLKCNKGNFIMIDDIIYHKDNVLGDTVTQLVLPKERRLQVLTLAHESVFGNHMGVKKTKERIRLSFFWPNMAKDVADFIKTCKNSQLRKPEKIKDRIPISPVLRPNLPFEIVNVDLIGPIEPPSARKHKYILCLQDQHSRWPEAIPLRSLTAKSTCDALLEIFSRTGIPSVIASDQATNFISQLTQEFLKRLGAHPRFSTPGYAASNGLVERYNKVIKNMLHHVIRTDPSNWDKHIPYLLFAYREVPNCTTGVSPFKLMYGREARGPLAVLKSSWSGEIPIPLGLNKSVVEYLQDLKVNLENAAEHASLTAAEKQSAYAEYFNRRAVMKEFKTGDQVYLLIPDSTNKLYARWTGPGEIMERCNPHSYRVKLPDGKIRHVHANKIRRYYPRVQAVGVIFENDNDFGEIHETPNASKIVDSQTVLQGIKCNHLSHKQREQLFNLLCKHQSLFTGKVKIAKVEGHKIRLKPNEERKKPYIYRIPESLKHKVDEQIEELLDLDLIEESDEEIAYPVVCVSKKDGGMRLCVDFRSLNVATITDDFPMEDATELLHDIGQANVITTLDLLKGYWAIPMDPKSRPYTAFKTHRQQYRFKVMSFGLKNASATFQRVMNRALYAYRDFARAYIDDIAIFSKDWKTHLEHLDTILTKLEELNFTVNVKKCDFAKPEIKYLGHIIGSGKHRTDPDKVKAIENLPSPKTKKELRSVLGLCNYYREYIPNYAELAYPLTELTKKKISDNIPWSEEHESAFLKLKACLVNAPSLYTPVIGKPFIIHSDASQIGVAACLSQKFEEKIYPISYISQKLTKSQQSWSTIEREAFAIVWSLKKFEVWIYGAEIEFYTDHNPLPFLTKSAPQSSRLQRWAFALQKYNITMKHCPGTKMPNADALSRLFPNETF